MSAVSKGNKIELEAKKTLEYFGWSVFRQHRKPIFMKGKMITIGADIFGVDLIAKKAGLRSAWIQVSTIQNVAAKKKQIENFVLIPAHERYLVWGRRDGKRVFEEHLYTGDGKNHSWQITQDIVIVEGKNE